MGLKLTTFVVNTRKEDLTEVKSMAASRSKREKSTTFVGFRGKGDLIAVKKSGCFTLKTRGIKTHHFVGIRGKGFNSS